MRTDLVKLLLLLIVLAVVVVLAGYFGGGERTPGGFDHNPQGAPSHNAPGESDRGPQEESGRNPPGRFDYYLLVLGWSPTYCASERHDRSDQQCETQHPRSFVLHGLWPQYERGWPKDCATGARPWVPRPVIDKMLDVMPSTHLIIHEYQTHGTCSGLGPTEYFSAARELYDRVRIPSRYADPATRLEASPDEIERDFVAANPWLKPDMMAVACRGEDLLDVRFCFGRDLAPRPCGANEDEKRLCRQDTVSLRPAEAGR
jgi:ribonuclease T2